MPLVFIISGYALSLAESSKRTRENPVGFKDYLKFLVARLSRILLPYYGYAIAGILICLIYSTYDSQSTWQFSQIAASWLNPFADRSQFTLASLKWHLWFIPTFLLVTAMLPIAIELKLPVRPPLWMLMVAATAAVYFLSLSDFPGSPLLKSVFYYLLWAMFGYHIATRGLGAYLAEYVKVAIISILGLLIIFSFNPDPQILIMQHNKFPPNHLFFLFNCIWVAIFLMLASVFQNKSQKFSRSLAQQWWLKPFITSGYSIYLWQGLGYSIAIRFGEYFDLPTFARWILALLCTVALGLLASPIERIKIKV
jgi:hypothetical protein